MSEIDQIREYFYAKGLYPDVIGIIESYIRKSCLHLVKKFTEKYILGSIKPKTKDDLRFINRFKNRLMPGEKAITFREYEEWRKKMESVIAAIHFYYVYPVDDATCDDCIHHEHQGFARFWSQTIIEPASDDDTDLSEYIDDYPEFFNVFDPRKDQTLETKDTVLESSFDILRHRIPYKPSDDDDSDTSTDDIYVFWQYYRDGQFIDIMSEFLKYSLIHIESHVCSRETPEESLNMVTKVINMLRLLKFQTFVHIRRCWETQIHIIVATEKTKNQILLGCETFEVDVVIDTVNIRNYNPIISVADLEALKSKC
jgi:hypothetical protein